MDRVWQLENGRLLVDYRQRLEQSAALGTTLPSAYNRSKRSLSAVNPSRRHCLLMLATKQALADYSPDSMGISAMIGRHNPEVALDPEYAFIAAGPLPSRRWGSSVDSNRYVAERPFRVGRASPGVSS